MPEASFFDAMTAVSTSNHLRRRPATNKDIEAVDPAKALKIFKERFADANGFTFVFVGNIDLGEAAAAGRDLPRRACRARAARRSGRTSASSIRRRRCTKDIVAGTEPKSFVSLSMGAPDKWTRDLERDAEILSMVLRIRLREVLREDMGGVYGVSVGASVSREPTQRRGLRVFFGCNPDNVDKLKAAVFEEVGKIAKDGVGAELPREGDRAASPPARGRPEGQQLVDGRARGRLLLRR